jgi:hypothetical protein
LWRCWSVGGEVEDPVRVEEDVVWYCVDAFWEGVLFEKALAEFDGPGDKGSIDAWRKLVILDEKRKFVLFSGDSWT